MKRVLTVVVLFLFLAGTVSADVGIGLKWFTEAEVVNEGEQKCVTYGIYNPFDTDVTGFLTATRELEGFYQAEEPKLIPAHTSSNEAISAQMCFNVPKVYKEEFYFGYLPQRQCSEDEIMLKGEVMAAYMLSGRAGTGSVTGVSFAAPMMLRVRCTPLERNWMPVFILIVLVMVVGIIVLVYLDRRSSD